MKYSNSFKTLLLFLFTTILLIGCNEESYTPKPRSHFRIDLPPKQYQKFEAEYCPCTFSFPTYGNVEQKKFFFNENPAHPCWMNIHFPYFNGTLYMNYVEVSTPINLEDAVQDAFKLAFKHSVRADFIDQTPIDVDETSGFLFDIGGNVGSSVQFFVTDSTEHFLRGSLHFNEQPNVDSLRPVIDYLREDVLSLMRSIKWK